MSEEISRMNAAIVSAAIIAHLAKPTTTKAASSGESVAQLQRSLQSLSERMKAIEERTEKLETSMNDVSRRIEEMSGK
jgi:methyl-accepting chemotaxis protein